MIFVTVGTNEARFDRLLHAVNALPRHEPLVVQRGSSEVVVADATCVDFMPFEELTEYVAEAGTVVSHAGIGSIMISLRHGKRPIVVPRRRQFGEAVDDHQVTLARQFDEARLVRLVEDPAILAEALTERDGAEIAWTSGTRLAGDLREYLTGALHS